MTFFAAFVIITVQMHGSKSRRRMLGCYARSPLLLCVGLLSTLSVMSCRSFAQDSDVFRMHVSLDCGHDTLDRVILIAIVK